MNSPSLVKLNSSYLSCFQCFHAGIGQVSIIRFSRKDRKFDHPEKEISRNVLLIFYFFKHCLWPKDLVIYFPFTIRKGEGEREIEELHPDKISSAHGAQVSQYLICNLLLFNSYMQF
jgi:type II restriction/modification system DNA methylase subunit YeeA